MADEKDKEDKTEEPSARRLEKAREEGQVALSQEPAALAVLGAAALMLVMVAPSLARGLVRQLGVMLEQVHLLDPMATLRASAVLVAVTAGPFVLAALFCAAMATLFQTGFLLNAKAAAPDFTRLSLFKGLKRVFGPTTLITAAKAVLKVLVVGCAGWLVLADALPLMHAALAWNAALLTGHTTGLVLRVMVAMLVAQALIATADIFITRYQHTKSLRMTREELRDEAKEMDGDPFIKARIRRIRMQRARRRMLAAVPNATVVITNPTHYAVALAYSRDGGGAPRIVAKGVDFMAARIREVAAEHRVPIVANPPLARALYPHELDREVPEAFFKPVAEIIAYVWRLRGIAP